MLSVSLCRVSTGSIDYAPLLLCLDASEALDLYVLDSLDGFLIYYWPAKGLC